MGRSTLSLDAASFFPGHLSAGRSKRLRWEDGSLSGDSDLERSPSPSLKAASFTRSDAAPSSASHPPMAAAAATPMPRRRRRRRRRHRRSGRRAATAPTGDCDPPRWGGTAAPSVAPRIPVQLRLGPRSRVSALDADGWRCTLPRSPILPVANQRLRRGGGEARLQLGVPPGVRPRIFPVDFRGRCFNCLSRTHRVATCRLPRHCLRCHGFGHIARDCKRPRSNVVATASTCHSLAVDGCMCTGWQSVVVVWLALLRQRYRQGHLWASC